MSVDRRPASLAHADAARRVSWDVFEYGDTARLVSGYFCLSTLPKLLINEHI